MNAIIPAGGNALIPTNMEGAMRLAEMMARGKLVPQHLRESPGDCLMVVEQSMRWGMSPFAVAQCTSVIQGKLMFEGKLVSAALHSSGILATRLEYEFSGDGPTRAITVRAILKGETEPRDVRVTLQEAKTTNGMWTKQPDQQLVYHGTRVWARRHAPEVMLGVYSPEEFEPAIRADADTFAGPTIEAQAEPMQQGQPRDTARAIGDELPPHALDGAPKPKGRKVSEILDEIEASFRDAIPRGRDAVDGVLASELVQKALDKLTNGARERLDSAIRMAFSATEDDIFPGDLPSKDAA